MYRSASDTSCQPCSQNMYTGGKGSASCHFCEEGKVPNNYKTGCSKCTICKTL